MRPTITYFNEGDAENEHVYVGRNFTFEPDDGKSVVARIYDDEPSVANLVDVSPGHAHEPTVEAVVDWLRTSMGVQTVRAMGPEGYIELGQDSL